MLLWLKTVCPESCSGYAAPGFGQRGSVKVIVTAHEEGGTGDRGRGGDR